MTKEIVDSVYCKGPIGPCDKNRSYHVERAVLAREARQLQPTNDLVNEFGGYSEAYLGLEGPEGILTLRNISTLLQTNEKGVKVYWLLILAVQQ